MVLDPVQIRILGALIEKEIATPEAYPLSLNALVAACNQRSSRDPVMDLSEEQVRQGLHALEDLGWTSVVRDSRVPKYEHRIRTVLNLRRDETAVLCLLFLRGPQTPGEIRARADRLYSFDDLEAVQSTLDRLARRPVAGAGTGAGAAEPGVGAQGTGPLVVLLPRQPGSREARFAHLLGGTLEGGRAAEAARESDVAQPRSRGLEIGDADAGDPGGAGVLDRLKAVEEELARLREAVAALEARHPGAAGAEDEAEG